MSETFVGPALRVGGDRYSLPAVWPRSHRTYSAKAHPPDSLLLCETFRQAAYVVCHTERGVPLGRKFLLSSMSLDEVSLLGRAAVSGDPMITVNVDELGRVEAESVPVRVSGEICLPGSFRATLAASGTILSERVYGRVRGNRPRSDDPAIAPSSLTARAPSSDALLAPRAGSREWTLVVDTNHPSHFDHPLDHVPGSLLLDAARSVMREALDRPDAQPESIDASFARFVELSEETDIRLSATPELMTVDFVQRGVSCAHVKLVPPKGLGGTE